MVFNEALNRGAVGGIPGTKCKYCDKSYTKEGHDGCIGTLIGTMNACCAHGIIKCVYIQFLDGECIRGKDALDIIKIIKNYKEE